MLAHWSFDDTIESRVGNEVRSLAKGKVAYETGRVGQALRLDGAKDGAHVTARGRLDDVTEITLSLWVRKRRPDASGTVLLRHVVYHVGLTKMGFNGYLFNDQRVRGRLGGRVGLDDTDWHHLCVVYDGKAIKSYLDAQEVSAHPFEGRVAQRKTDVYIGKNPWDACFDGLIDEVRIFDWALDARQVAELAGPGAGGMSDSEAVRALLDHNGLTKREVEGAAVFNQAGRVVQLNIQKCGAQRLTLDFIPAVPRSRAAGPCRHQDDRGTAPFRRSSGSYRNGRRNRPPGRLSMPCGALLMASPVLRHCISR